MSDERIINRVRKLMALAADPAASDGERDNALRMAYATVAKYNLDMQSIEGQAPVSPQEARGERRVECYGRPWAMQLAGAVGRLFFCKLYYMRSLKKDFVWFHFVGKESNAEAACEVLDVLIASIFAEAKRKMRQNNENVTWRRSFCTGASFRVQDRIRELQTAAPSLEAPVYDEDGELIPALEDKAAARSTALVLVNVAKAEAEANEQWITENVGKLRAAKQRQSHEIKHEAYAKGREFGSSLNLAATKKLK
jgi:hypothetical protein